jgi:hypothetical protein
MSACRHEIHKKGKVPVTGERNSFTGMYCRNLKFTPSKINELQVFLRVLPQKEKALQRQNRNPPAPYKSGKLQIRSDEDLFV